MGNPNAACKNLTTFSVDSNLYTLDMALDGASQSNAIMCIARSVILLFNGTCHNPCSSIHPWSKEALVMVLFRSPSLCTMMLSR